MAWAWRGLMAFFFWLGVARAWRGHVLFPLLWHARPRALRRCVRGGRWVRAAAAVHCARPRDPWRACAAR
eukprot:gene8711-biopygen10675